MHYVIPSISNTTQFRSSSTPTKKAQDVNGEKDVSMIIFVFVFVFVAPQKEMDTNTNIKQCFLNNTKLLKSNIDHPGVIIECNK